MRVYWEAAVEILVAGYRRSPFSKTLSHQFLNRDGETIQNLHIALLEMAFIIQMKTYHIAKVRHDSASHHVGEYDSSQGSRTFVAFITSIEGFWRALCFERTKLAPKLTFVAI